jgi:hypothetical protein
MFLLVVAIARVSGDGDRNWKDVGVLTVLE